MAKTLTIDISDDVMLGLDQLASRSSTSSVRLASEALSAYVAGELDAIQGIERGLLDLDTGKVVSHRDAMDEITSIINASRSSR